MSRPTTMQWWALLALVGAGAVVFVWYLAFGSGSGSNVAVGTTETTTSGVGDISAATATTIEPQVPDKPPDVRDPTLWPYPWDSIWNTPIGDRADLVPFEMVIPTERTLNIEEDIIIIAPDAPGQTIQKHDAAWEDGRTRCGSRIGKVLAENIPIPEGWKTDPGYTGSKPNHSAAILMPDMTLFETQPFHICEDGVAVSQFTNGSWQGDSILTGGMGAPDGGSHGGSFMTAFGGTIRLGEWVPGGVIRHVLKIDVYSQENLSPLNGGFRWPALQPDRGYDDPIEGYGGSVPEARMGSLLALPPGFDIGSLTSEPGAILARALQDYGAYIVDGTGWSTAAFAVEWGPNGRVKDEFEQVWGFPMVGHRKAVDDGPQRRFLQDMETIYAALNVVNDNTSANTGGAGDRLAPWAPPFTDGTGGPP